jgi:drug/metabolite transporter (DMT)-like permease
VATLAFLVAILGVPLALAEGRRRGPRPAAAWAWLAMIGVLDAGNSWCYFRALAEGAVAPAVLSHYLAPVIVAGAAPLVLGEPRAPRTSIALALAMVGTAILVLSGGKSHGAPVGPAIALGSASAVFYAANVLVSKRLGPQFGNAELMSYHAIVSAAVLLPLSASGFDLAHPRTLLLPIAGGFVSTLLAGMIYYAGLRRVAADRAAILTYLEPLVAVLVGWLALAETPSPSAIAGGTLVLAGGILVIL